ncbi:MAG: leucyl/phenylalanyl-tRNA--protein transferase, partial [Myxococcota bacterium]
SEDGLLAVGGDFDPDRLLVAYAMGIFPWSEYRGEPLWYSPDPRMVLRPSHLHVGRSLRKTMRKHPYRVTADTAFQEVVEHCRQTPRPDQDGTWITDRYVASLCELHRRGLAHSAEAWQGDTLVGGAYGISLGAAFFGESMFAHAPDASKIAFVRLVQSLDRAGVTMVDCQMETPHLARFGATNWPRHAFVDALREALKLPTRLGPWRLTDDD